MKVLMFQPWKAALVESGASRQTIRPTRKRPINVGDELSLRTWRGKPYQSKQRILKSAICRETFPIELIPDPSPGLPQFPQLRSYGTPYSLSASNKIAQMDGFVDFGQMVQWFSDTHGLPFHGTVIRW